MIDEKKLIYWIKSHCNPYGKPDLGLDTSIKIMEFIEKQMEKVGEWIPCSERLPEDGESYLVTNAESFGQFHTYKGWYDGERKIWHMDGNFERKMNVIAWQPLPEPYREKDDTERMTNADRIRSMTDEELADFIEMKQFFAIARNGTDGEEYTLQWLHEEVEDNKDD